MEPTHGVPRNGVLHAPVDGCVQTRMELGMSNAYQYVCQLSKVCELTVLACGAALLFVDCLDTCTLRKDVSKICSSDPAYSCFHLSYCLFFSPFRALIQSEGS